MAKKGGEHPLTSAMPEGFARADTRLTAKEMGVFDNGGRTA
ncbi:MAG TPA: hypothetical protein VD713_07765 [Sphingomonadales bacterium]|nr:hypothetical protein [Sphingomonadales bacterium]